MNGRQKSSDKNRRDNKNTSKGFNGVNGNGASKKRQALKKPCAGTCFVVMPFGQWFDQYYKTIYVPAIRISKFQPVRADDKHGSGPILNDIQDCIKKSQIVLADISGANPNVYYEIGYADSKGKPVVLVMDSSTTKDIPFDLRAFRIIMFDKNNPKWAEILINNIVMAIRETLGSGRKKPRINEFRIQY